MEKKEGSNGLNIWRFQFLMSNGKIRDLNKKKERKKEN